MHITVASHAALTADGELHDSIEGQALKDGARGEEGLLGGRGWCTRDWDDSCRCSHGCWGLCEVQFEEGRGEERRLARNRDDGSVVSGRLVPTTTARLASTVPPGTTQHEHHTAQSDPSPVSTGLALPHKHQPSSPLPCLLSRANTTSDCP
jgi:hypothetical protein